jgi:hypothetical protein
MARSPASVKFVGVNKVVRNLKEVMNISGDEVYSALYTEANLLMGQSVRIVPVKTGTLRRSAFIRQSGRTVKNDPDGTIAATKRSPGRRKKLSKIYKVVMGYNTVYALRQHEEMDWKHRGRGEPKYLEKPLMAIKNKLGERIAKRLYLRWQREQMVS